jgi:hypothetical protein
VFSSTAFAVATMPTSQPARVKATQGAGVFLPFSVSMLNVRSVCLVESPVGFAGSKMASVQYANDTPVLLVPLGLK